VCNSSCNIEILQYIYSQFESTECEWYDEITSNIVQNAYQRTSKLDDDSVSEEEKKKRLEQIKEELMEMLTFLIKAGVIWHMDAAWWSIDVSFNIFKFCIENGCPYNREKCLKIAKEEKKQEITDYIENLLDLKMVDDKDE
jgi:hypothetical protein